MHIALKQYMTPLPSLKPPPTNTHQAISLLRLIYS